MEQKAQGAIEYLLIIGAAILVVAIVILAVTGALSASRSDVNGSNNDVNNSLQGVRCSGNCQVLGSCGTSATATSGCASVAPANCGWVNKPADMNCLTK